MKFSVNAVLLLKALRLLTSSDKHSFLIIMSARAAPGEGEGCLIFQTLEGQKYVTLSLAANVTEEGEVRFDSSYLPYFDCGRDGEKESITISSKKASFLIRGACDFTVPLIDFCPQQVPSRQAIGSATFDLTDLKQLFKRVLFAVGDDSGPSDFSCMLLEFYSATLRAVGGDRRLVSVADVIKGSPYEGIFSLPKSGVAVINKLDGDIVTLTFHEEGITVSSFGEVMCDIYMPALAKKAAISGYGSLFDEFRGHTFLNCDKEVLLAMIEAIRKVSEQLYIAMKYDGHGVQQPPRMFARQQDGPAQVNATVPAQWEGLELKIAVNAKSLQQAVEQATGKVRISFSSNLGPMIIEGEGGNYRTLLLPYSVEKR